MWLRLLSTVLHFSCYFVAVMGGPMRSEVCIKTCLQEFMSTSGKTAFGENTKLEEISWKEILELSAESENDENVIRIKFENICRSYQGMKDCLKRCNSPPVLANIVKGFESLEYICFKEKEEFLHYLPCLARNEVKVMRRCKTVTNQTILATQALQKAAYHNHVDQFKSLLAGLCRNTSLIIDCMTPATTEFCGERPAIILRHLVALSFNNIETLYINMGMSDELPISCRELGKMGAPPPIDEADWDNIDPPQGRSAKMDTYTNSAPIASICFITVAFVTLLSL